MTGGVASYRVTDLLRESARSVFYRALDPAEQPVVLEVLREATHGPEDLVGDLGRLENEYQIARALSANAVVRPIAVGRWQGHAAIVREEVSGCSLDTLTDRPLGIARFLALALAAAQALREVHAAGLIHRDIKPANLMVDEPAGQVRITDFTLATFLPREQGPDTNPARLEGTLAYMSPEQTGRMNRAVDQRSDLYSLGVTFYEMLTGHAPFTASDPLEWVHCQIARTPATPLVVRPTVPEPLSRMVMKLLAKAPEDRYQSAGGLVHDLQRCQQQWATTGGIEEFALAARDVSDRWLLPQRLYGREAEEQVLLAAYNEVAKRAGPALVLVSGDAGAGKSALVNELRRPVAGSRGVFAEGKFDPFTREVPYATFVQALRALVLDVLTENDAGLAHWRERFQRALGLHGQVMVELIAPLELVIGKQPPVAELAPPANQARLALRFRKLLQAIGGPQRPLVLFLDDLQWADAGSLRLLEQAMADPDLTDLMIVGAYRDNDVDRSDALAASLRTIRGTGAQVRDVPLGPLRPADLVAMASSLLHRESSQVEPLAALVHEKTGGNPFFARQFLDGLHREGLIWFDRRALQWQWDLSRIAAEDFTGNVAEYMVERLGGLSSAARRLLGVAAFVGTSWDAALLAEVLDVDPATVTDELGSAISKGLLVRRDGSHRFSHDRVRQAAYQLVPEPDRAAVHLQVGQALLARTPPAALGDVLFEVVHQLNQGAEAIADQALRRQAAALNLQAGRQAKRAAAYDAAVAYCRAGAALLASLPRDTLAFDLDLEHAECHLLNGEHAAALALLTPLLERARDVRERVAVYRARQGALQLSGQITQAVDDELAGLLACGIELPARPTPADVAAERARVQALLARCPPERLVELPALTDPDKLAALQLVTPSFFTDQRLFFVHVARMVALSLEHGIGPNASYWFSNYALGMAGFGDYRDARRLAAAAHQLALREPVSPRLSEAAFVLGELSFWTEPYEDAIALLRTAYRTGLEDGSPMTPLMSACLLLVLRLARGDVLPEVEAEADEYLALLTRAGARDLRDLVAGQRQFVRQLRGQTRALGSFDAEDFDAQGFEAALTPDRMTTALCWYWIHRLRAAYLAGDITLALATATRAQELLWSSRGLPPHRELVLYHALSLAAALDTAAAESRGPWHTQLQAHEQQLRDWATLNPASFAHGHLLVAAELARIEGRFAEALQLYDRSIMAARAGHFALDEALAFERLAHCHQARGADALAELCLREACAGYASRGATAKVRQLQASLPGQPGALLPRATVSAPADKLDVLSVVQASQAISGEVTVGRVTVRLMELVLAEGGAERGLLVQPDGDVLVLAAQATSTARGIEVQLGEPALTATPAAAPLSLLQYVWRTSESVVLDDATGEPRYADDEYVQRAQPRSVLCAPIRRQGQVVALLYLENRAVAGAFTWRRLQVLELLAAQAAISLQNAALLEHERAARDAAKEAARRAALLAEASALLGESLDYQVVLSHLGRILVQHVADWCVIDLVEPALRFQEGRPSAHTFDAVTVPLLAHGRGLGTISLGPRQRLAQDDLKLVEEIARRAAIAIENGELFRKSEQAVRLREEFLSVASHELNTPLAGLTLSVQALRDRTQGGKLLTPWPPEVSGQLADLVFRHTQRLSRLVTDLLDVTHLQTKPLTLTSETIDLGGLVHDVLGNFASQSKRARCHVSSHIETAVLVSGDRARLEQVLLNLLSNAVKFGVGQPIEVALQRNDGTARLTVSDQGIGIDPARHALIFERFERGVSASHYGGLGLGLYICREIVAAHRGLIRVESQSGHGAKFTVELPATDPSAVVPG